MNVMVTMSYPRAVRRWWPTRVSGLASVLALMLPATPVSWAAPLAHADLDAPWRWPLDPVPAVVRGFEPPADPWGPGHRGLDLVAALGEPVTAVAAGTVTFAGQVAGVAVVVVSHGRLRSTYQPVEAVVHVGDQVSAGTRLGAVTAVGSHCLPAVCLHLGARIGDRYLDPATLLPDPAIRLKPLDGLPIPAAPARERRWARPPPAVVSGARMGLTVGSA